jgi:predicted alpha/beta superfamily hydrolase
MADWHDYPPQEDELEHSVVGHVLVLEGVPSPQLDNARDIYVYLPPSYHTETIRRYPVLYMHDGQNLFDQATSFSEEWHVDASLEAAASEGLEAIVVGIPNMGEDRIKEYSPFKDKRMGGGRAQEYLRFVAETLKPLIDLEFRTLADREHTGIAGSSMGGLVSLYGFFHCSKTFGFVGVMSPALWFANRAVMTYVEGMPHVAGKIYLDVGTEEGKQYVADAQRLRDLLIDKGYVLEQDLCYVEDQGAAHEEAAWARRFAQALPFLIARTEVSSPS